MVFSITAAMSKYFKCTLKAFKSFCKCYTNSNLYSEFIVGDVCKLKFNLNSLRNVVSSKCLSTLIIYLRKNVIRIKKNWFLSQ